MKSEMLEDNTPPQLAYGTAGSAGEVLKKFLRAEIANSR
jgi:hypothetical protein